MLINAALILEIVGIGGVVASQLFLHHTTYNLFLQLIGGAFFLGSLAIAGLGAVAGIAFVNSSGEKGITERQKRAVRSLSIGVVIFSLIAFLISLFR